MQSTTRPGVSPSFTRLLADMAAVVCCEAEDWHMARQGLPFGEGRGQRGRGRQRGCGEGQGWRSGGAAQARAQAHEARSGPPTKAAARVRGCRVQQAAAARCSCAHAWRLGATGARGTHAAARGRRLRAGALSACRAGSSGRRTAARQPQRRLVTWWRRGGGCAGRLYRLGRAPLRGRGLRGVRCVDDDRCAAG